VPYKELSLVPDYVF